MVQGLKKVTNNKTFVIVVCRAVNDISVLKFSPCNMGNLHCLFIYPKIIGHIKLNCGAIYYSKQFKSCSISDTNKRI